MGGKNHSKFQCGKWVKSGNKIGGEPGTPGITSGGLVVGFPGLGTFFFGRSPGKPNISRSPPLNLNQRRHKSG